MDRSDEPIIVKPVNDFGEGPEMDRPEWQHTVNVQSFIFVMLIIMGILGGALDN